MRSALMNPRHRKLAALDRPAKRQAKGRLLALMACGITALAAALAPGSVIASQVPGDRAQAAQWTATPAIVTAPVMPTARPVATIHVVQRGETLYRIALLYGSSVDAIVRANGLSDPERIQIGQRLIIPDARADALTGAGGAPGALMQVTVGPADSVQALALRYGTTVERIASQNGIINPASIYVGLPLVLSSGSEGRAPLTVGRTYVVQNSDTLPGIEARFGVSAEVVARINRFNGRSWLYPGERIIIPDSNAPLADLPMPLTGFTMQPESAEQGRTFVLTVTTDHAAKLSGTFLDRPLVDQPADPGIAPGGVQVHRMLVAIDAFARIGVFPLTLSIDDGQGNATTITRNFAVDDGGYGSERITLPKDQLDLLDPKITQPELDRVLAIVAPVTTVAYLTAPLGLPVPAAISSQFGTRRSYNGLPFNQFHSGTDFAGAPGSPIYAPGPGKVVFVGQLYVRGNATIIDHGWGIYTGYWHQSQTLVKVGDVVAQGQIIGRIGSTGRVTGPHLHWELFVNGVQVDPIQWVREGIR
jgi:murein DD-endopeptidase MepM/ murein hydrolase activator NlpD